MLTHALAAVILLHSPIDQTQKSAPLIYQPTSVVNQANESSNWGNAEVVSFLSRYGPDKNIADLMRSSPLIGLFRDFNNNLANYDVSSGFNRIVKHVRGITLNDYLNIGPNDRRRLFEEDVATESLRQFIGSHALTVEMIDFINANYGTEQMTAKQTMDALALMHHRLTEPEDPFVAPPVPAENVNLAFPVLAQVDSQSTYWTYDRNARTMTIVASEDANAAAGEAPVSESPPQTAVTMRGWSIEAVHNGPPTMRVVGGRQVAVVTDYVMGFGQVQQSSRVLEPTSGSVSQARLARVFRHTFSIEPEAARALSGALELQVSGKTRPWRDDQRTLCVSVIYIEERPVTRVQSCFLTGVLETYRVVDKRDGSVIHEWDAR